MIQGHTDAGGQSLGSRASARQVPGEMTATVATEPGDRHGHPSPGGMGRP